MTNEVKDKTKSEPLTPFQALLSPHLQCRTLTRIAEGLEVSPVLLFRFYIMSNDVKHRAFEILKGRLLDGESIGETIEDRMARTEKLFEETIRRCIEGEYGWW